MHPLRIKGLIKENYYPAETEFVRLNAEHYRGIATAAGVLLGFFVLFVSSSTKESQVHHLLISYKWLIGSSIILYLLSLITGVLCGIFKAKAMIFAFRHDLHPSKYSKSVQSKLDKLLNSHKITKETFNIMSDQPARHKAELDTISERNYLVGNILGLICNSSFILGCIFAGIFFWKLIAGLH